MWSNLLQSAVVVAVFVVVVVVAVVAAAAVVVVVVVAAVVAAAVVGFVVVSELHADGHAALGLVVSYAIDQLSVAAVYCHYTLDSVAKQKWPAAPEMSPSKTKLGIPSVKMTLAFLQLLEDQQLTWFRRMS